MATSTTKKRRSSSKKQSKPALVPEQRKKEILGLVLMVLALLVGLAVLTYSSRDDALARDFSFGTAFRPGGGQASNALGMTGAALARFFVPEFLGYTSLLPLTLLFAWGYVIFRRRQTVYLPLLSVLTIVGAFVLATFLGWFGYALERELGLWSGAVGLGVAGWMWQVFGGVGSFVLLLLLLAVTVLLVVDHDIQRSLDRLEELLRSIRDQFSTWRQTWRERRTERLAERKRLREERDRQRREQERAADRQRTENAREPSPSQPPRPPRPVPAEPPPAPARRAPVPPVYDDRDVPPPAGRSVNDLFRDFSPPGAPPEPASSDGPRPSRPADAPSHELELKVRERVEEEKALTIERAARGADLPYESPPIELLDEADAGAQQIDFDELEDNKRILLDKLATYNIEITDINAIVGPTVTLYELTPAPGVKISRITALEDDLAMAMAARGIRMIAPIPGKTAIGVEIPNRHRELVRLRDVIGTAKFRDADMQLPIALGKTIEGEVFLQDLTKMPHLLIAGATGSGKSVGLNTIIAGLLYACHPSNLKFVMIDPKKIELQQYKELIDHYLALPEDGDDAIITDFNDALDVFKSCEREMERRYDLLSTAAVRSVKDYNRKLADGRIERGKGHRHLPYIVVIVDELADLMMTAGKDIEGPIARLAQMARAVGIHLVLATQRPSVDVITGLIKANFPSRVAFQVASKIDARTILDQNGAEGLVGNGDLLFMSGSRLIRLQGPFVSVDEVDRLMEFISAQPGPGPYTLPPGDPQDGGDGTDVAGLDDADDLFEEAARIIVRAQQGSVSLLQRKLSVGYTRAARIVDQLEEAGIVGAFVGSKAREVLVADEQQLDTLLNDRSGDA